MKNFLFALLFCFYFLPSNAQLLDRVKNKIERKVGEKIDESIDKATQKKKPKENPPAKEPTEQRPVSGSLQDIQQGETEAVKTKQQPTEAKSATSENISSYSRFDFIAGEKVLIHEDFSQEAIGDFPANWNTRSGAEVVTMSNREGKWLRMGQTGVFYPEYISENLPENFTLQVELQANQHIAGIGQWMVSFMQTRDVNEIFKLGAQQNISNVPNFKINLQPASSGGKGQLHYSSNLIGNQFKNATPEFNVPGKPVVNISIWRQKQRIRVYFDSTKVLDLPRVLDASATLNSIVFSSYNPEYDHKDGAFFMSNIRLAVGAPNLRNKLMQEGRFSTSGILFDTNSDKIQRQSYGSLQDIAAMLKENATLRVKIVGHTDSDGNGEANMELSKRRAEAVKNALITTFEVDASRLESDGKGKAEPVDTNEMAAGKANNRRVEFVKL
jgi:OOP family OmpA-OmpF porin